MRTSHLLASLVALGVSVVCAGAFAQPAKPAQKDQNASGAEKKPSADHAANKKNKKKPAKEKEQKNAEKQPAKQAGATGEQNKTEPKGNQPGKAQGAAAGAAGATSGSAGAAASGTAGASASGAATPPAAKSAASKTPAAAPKAAKPSTMPAAPAPPPGANQPATGSAGGSAQFGVAASVGAPASPQSDQNASAGKSKKQGPLINTIGIELEGGPNARLDGRSSGITDSEAVGLTYGLGVWYSPSRLWSFGLSYQHTGLGGSSTAPSATGNTVSADRTLHSLWLSGRAYPWRTDSLGVYLALELGAAWQHVDASGESVTNPNVTAPQPFACSATAGPGIAIGAGGGLDVDLDPHLAFLVQADIAENRLTSNQIGGCTQGSGSVSNLAARIGFMYRFAVGPQNSSATASGTPTVARF